MEDAKIKKSIELKNMMVISNEFYKLTNIAERSTLIIDNVELIPIVVNCTFSIEVALKCLYYANNKAKIGKIHNIRKIYELTKAYGLEEYLLRDFKQIEINKILDELENAFEEFRYLYEQTKIIQIVPAHVKDFSAYINAYCKAYLKEEWDIDIN